MSSYVSTRGRDFAIEKLSNTRYKLSWSVTRTLDTGRKLKMRTRRITDAVGAQRFAIKHNIEFPT